MKPSHKYGSVYPAAVPRKASPTPHRRKAVPGDVAGVAPKVAPTAADAGDALKLPHERDESVDHRGGDMPSDSVRQASRDVQRGLPDTDRGAEVNRTYQKLKT
jgi:hypothetical protein